LRVGGVHAVRAAALPSVSGLGGTTISRFHPIGTRPANGPSPA
jgi:hypothetical protein